MEAADQSARTGNLVADSAPPLNSMLGALDPGYYSAIQPKRMQQHTMISP